MDFQFIIVFITHIFIHFVMHRYFKQDQSCNFSIFSWSSSLLRLSEPASVMSFSLKSWVKLKNSVSANCCIFEHSECSPFDFVLLSGYLSKPTRLLLIAGLQLLLDNHKLLLFEIAQYYNFQLVFDKNNWFSFNNFAEIETGNPPANSWSQL